MIEITLYTDKNGNEPFGIWMSGLRSRTAKSRLMETITRIETGLMGHVKSVGKGVQEIKLNFECGYRIYFGNDGSELVVLLAGSDKDDQRRVIKEAQSYWEDYKYQKQKPTLEDDNENRKRLHRGGAKKR